MNTKKRFRLIKKLKPVPTIYPACTKASFTSKRLSCSRAYLFAKYEDHVVFHKIVLNELHGPEVTACIRVDDKLRRKLFLRGSPVPLPQ